jgi:hypothetical protein
VAKDAPACSAVEAENEVIVITTVTPIDLYFMIDKSGSMTTMDVPGNPSRWAALLAAIGSFADASAIDGGSAGIGVGMGFFPITSVAHGGTGLISPCVVADYARAVVPLLASFGRQCAAVKVQLPPYAQRWTPTAPALPESVHRDGVSGGASGSQVGFAADGVPNDAQHARGRSTRAGCLVRILSGTTS